MFLMVIVKYYWTNKTIKLMLIFTLLGHKRIFPDFQGRYMEVQQNYSTCESSSYSNGDGSNDSMRNQKAFFNTNRFFTFYLT